jgi:hypothetical protein
MWRKRDGDTKRSNRKFDRVKGQDGYFGTPTSIYAVSRFKRLEKICGSLSSRWKIVPYRFW